MCCRARRRDSSACEGKRGECDRHGDDDWPTAEPAPLERIVVRTVHEPFLVRRDRLRQAEERDEDAEHGRYFSRHCRFHFRVAPSQRRCTPLCNISQSAYAPAPPVDHSPAQRALSDRAAPAGGQLRRRYREDRRIEGRSAVYPARCARHPPCRPPPAALRGLRHCAPCPPCANGWFHRCGPPLLPDNEPTSGGRSPHAVRGGGRSRTPDAAGYPFLGYRTEQNGRQTRWR